VKSSPSSIFLPSPRSKTLPSTTLTSPRFITGKLLINELQINNELSIPLTIKVKGTENKNSRN
jgi:hypothetical protein